MSHLENLERRLREMSENGSGGDTILDGKCGEDSSPGTEAVNDLNSPRRFVRVIGYDGRYNDLVYCKPLSNAPPDDEEISVDSDSNSLNQKSGDHSRQRCMVFFGGDMQDFSEIMDQHKEHRIYMRWSLEATANILQKQYPSHHIVIIRPSRIQIMTFSCFDNFVNSASSTGIPDHVITHGSLQHLQCLLKNLSDRVEKSHEQDNLLAKQIVLASKEENENESEVSSTTPEEAVAAAAATAVTSTSNGVAIDAPLNPQLHRAKLSIVGFSKGCVVLNQFLYEFHYLKTLTPDDTTMNPFVSCIEDMYWLDGGHNGAKNTWITSRSLIETLFRLNIRVHIHMTPYQLADERRPWIRKEERMFSDWLKRFNASIKRYQHFDDEPPALLQHFKVIEEFGVAEKTREPEQNNTEDFHVDTETVLSM